MITITSPQEYDQMRVKIRLQKEVLTQLPKENNYRSDIEVGLKTAAANGDSAVVIPIVLDWFDINIVKKILNDYEVVGWHCLIKQCGDSWTVLMNKDKLELPKTSFVHNLLNSKKKTIYHKINF